MEKIGQVFTPIEMVDKMLQVASLDSALHEKSFLENSCGNGNILVEVVRKYIESAKKSNLGNHEIKILLEKNIYAYETDGEKRTECKIRLNELTIKQGIGKVKWKIFEKDFLRTTFNNKYDLIIGNPPYISYRDLSIADREFIKSRFTSCKKGKPDYCYAFIQKSIELLAVNGILVYLVPMSVFRNVYAKELRNLMKDDLESLYDFSNIKVFDKVTIATAIFKIVKGSNTSLLKYSKFSLGSTTNFDKKSLNDMWMLSHINSDNKQQHRSEFGVQNSVATLKNSIFVFKDYTMDNQYLYYGKYKIEMALVYPASSPKGRAKNRRHKMLFPYKVDNDRNVQNFTEDELAKNYPNAYSYLRDNYEDLIKRKVDKNSQWFEYGRTQALRKIWRRKLLISKVVTTVPKVYILEENEIPYSGIFMFEKDENTLEQLKLIIESKDFYNYACSVGTNVNGNSVQISTKIIENFTFKKTL